MSDTSKEVKISLKVMINKQKTRVLFAEADSDFADILLSFLTLPLGTIVRVLKKHYGDDEAHAIGSLTTLYNSLANLESGHFWTDGGKQMLLNPRSSFESACRKLKLNIDNTEPAKFFRCADRKCTNNGSPNISMYYGTVKCDCGKPLSRAMGTIVSENQAAGDGEKGAFTEKQMSFFVTDDLQMAPIVPGCIIQTLISLGITVREGSELMTVTLGLNEIRELLKGSLLSKTPLTDLILHKSHRTECVTGDLPHQMKEQPSFNSKKMILKAVVKKSTKEVIFVEAEEDFVDFLFSFLTIPLGGVECLLDGSTSLRNIDNLHRSLANLTEKFMKSPEIKNRLMRPEHPPKYLSKNQIFPLIEQMSPTIYCINESQERDTDTGSINVSKETGYWMCFKDPKGDHGSYVKLPGNFVVTDDLYVAPLFMASSLPILNSRKIALSDVEKLQLHIGLKEVLGILKASLTSTRVLTDGLIDLVLKKQTELEN